MYSRHLILKQEKLMFYSSGFFFFFLSKMKVCKWPYDADSMKEICNSSFFTSFLIALPFFEILMSRNFQPKQGTIVEPTMERISMCNTNVQ